MKKHPNIRRFLALVLFFLGFALLIAFGNMHLIQTDTVARMTIYEMQQRDDIELALVGSSIVRDHFNAQLITEQTGLETFCASIPTASTPTSIALVKELLRTNSPEWIVLVTEPYNFQTVKESTEAFYKLAPYLSDPANLLDYYLRTARDDNAYLERLLPLRGFGAQSMRDVLKTVSLRYFPEAAYARLKPDMDPTVDYQGSGFLRHETDYRADAEFRTVIREHSDYYYYIFDRSKQQILELKQLCEDHGAKFLIIAYPNHVAHSLAEPNFAPYNDDLMRFSRETGIPCYNFSFAKPELMPDLRGYFYDLYHMVGEGADILSSTFCDVFNAHRRGEDLSDLFYYNTWNLHEAIDFITNTWAVQFDPDEEWDKALIYHKEAQIRALAGESDVFLFDCNRGMHVVPQYRFVIRHEDGTETLLQDYSADAYYTCEPGALSGKTLRLYARVQGQENPEEHWYDLVAE
ncbi:MAG: hypothetical protein IKJ11_03400 [Clostridia bacterium]|nr:hypothetical protein [Clostridia bacterium]